MTDKRPIDANALYEDVSLDGWLNPDYGGTIHHVVEWQYPQRPSRERG